MKNTLQTIIARLDETEQGCLLWTGGRHDARYGQISFQSRMSLVHRVVYEQLFGPIPEGYHLHHLCGNRLCANPLHLQEVNEKEHPLLEGHLAAKIAARMTCPRGHLLEPVPEGTRTGRQRYCLECERKHPKNYRANTTADRIVRHKSHCKRDHPLSGDNLYVTPNGEYHCRTCRREEKIERRKRKPLPPKLPKTHCAHGHPMSGENLRINAGGERICVTCYNRRMAEHNARRRAQRTTQGP